MTIAALLTGLALIWHAHMRKKRHAQLRANRAELEACLNQMEVT